MQECLSILNQVVQILAILIGGFWAYYKFFKGRLFKPRLELSVESKVINNSDLLIKYEIKNVGYSKVNLNREASGLRIMKYQPVDDPLEIENADWILIGSFQVIEKHKWIESGEIIKESRLFSFVDNNLLYLQSILKITGEEKSWEATSIIRNDIN